MNKVRRTAAVRSRGLRPALGGGHARPRATWAAGVPERRDGHGEGSVRPPDTLHARGPAPPEARQGQSHGPGPGPYDRRRPEAPLPPPCWKTRRRWLGLAANAPLAVQPSPAGCLEAAAGAFPPPASAQGRPWTLPGSGRSLPPPASWRQRSGFKVSPQPEGAGGGKPAVAAAPPLKQPRAVVPGGRARGPCQPRRCRCPSGDPGPCPRSRVPVHELQADPGGVACSPPCSLMSCLLWHLTAARPRLRKSPGVRVQPPRRGR